MAQSSSNKGSSIRTYGDPVLAAMADEITNIDGKLVTLAEDMFRVMYQAPGLGLAGPQIGVQKQIFVYDVDDDPQVIINPKIVESSGEWVYDEGCLSIPGLYVEMLRPKKVLVSGYTLEGEEVKIEADELLARIPKLLGKSWTSEGKDGRPIESRALTQKDILVVTGYNAQVRYLKARLRDAGFSEIRVGTVDKFQGQEAPVVFVSMDHKYYS